MLAVRPKARVDPFGGTRSGKLATKYLAFIQLAFIRPWLGVDERDVWASRAPLERAGEITRRNARAVRSTR